MCLISSENWSRWKQVTIYNPCVNGENLVRIHTRSLVHLCIITIHFLGNLEMHCHLKSQTFLLNLIAPKPGGKFHWPSNGCGMLATRACHCSCATAQPKDCISRRATMHWIFDIGQLKKKQQKAAMPDQKYGEPPKSSKKPQPCHSLGSQFQVNVRCLPAHQSVTPLQRFVDLQLLRTMCAFLWSIFTAFRNIRYAGIFSYFSWSDTSIWLAPALVRIKEQTPKTHMFERDSTMSSDFIRFSTLKSGEDLRVQS